MEIIEAFVEKLVAEKGFDTKDPDVLAQIKTDLTSRVEDRINAMILANLPEESLDGFEDLLGGKDEAQIHDYVKKYIPDLDEKIASTLLAFRTIYLS